MKQDELNMRRTFLKDGGAAFLAATGLMAVTQGKAKASEEAVEECECIQGCVLLRKDSGEAKMYQAIADTGSARFDALLEAINEAKISTGNVIIELLQGEFTLPESLMYYYQPSVVSGGAYTGKLKIIFHQGSSLIYDGYSKSRFDYPFLEGPRNVRNFGAKGNGTDDDWQSIMSAMYSLVPNGGAFDEFGMEIRAGQVYFPNGFYKVSKEIIIQPLMQFIGEKKMLTQIQSMDDFSSIRDPDADYPDENWVIRVARHAYGANTTHHVSIMELTVVAGGTGNELLNGILFYGAQMSEIDVIIANAYRGLVIGRGSDFVFIRRTVIDHCRYSALELINCNSIIGGDISIYGMDPLGLTGNYPIYMDSCASIVIASCLTEMSHNGIKIVNCTGVTVNGHESSINTSNNLAAPGDPPVYAPIGGTAIFIESSFQIRFPHFRGGGMQDLLINEQFSQRVHSIPGNTSGWASATYQSEQHIRLLGTSEIIWPRNDSSVPGAERWRVDVGQASNNPSWTLASFTAAGGSFYEHIRVALANGASVTGYTILLDYNGNGGVYIGSKLCAAKGYAVIQGNSDPTSADIPHGCRQTWRNGAGQIRDWVNIGGTLYKSALYS